MSNQNRKKASDVFRDTNFVFSSKTSFSVAFPKIDSVNITVIEVEGPEKVNFDSPPPYPARSMTYSEKTIGEFIDCHNSICYNGGFQIGSILHEMVRTKETFRESVTCCQGYEGSPKGKRRYRSCLHYFHYRVTIEYKA